MAFKAGDKVVRIATNWHDCKIGDVVTVIHDQNGNLTCQEHPGQVFSSHRFKLQDAEDEPEAPKSTFKVGDTVVRKVEHVNGMFPSIATVYVVEEIMLTDIGGGTKEEKIKLQDTVGYWYADKFALSTAKAEEVLPTVLAVGVRFKFKNDNYTWIVVDEQEDDYKITSSDGQFTNHVWPKTHAAMAQGNTNFTFLPNDIPKDFAPGVWVKINKIVHTSGLDGTKKAKWQGAVIQLRKKSEGTRWHPEARPDLDMSIHNWIDVRDCTIVAAPIGAIPAYVPPPPRKVKIYNAERKSHV